MDVQRRVSKDGKIDLPLLGELTIVDMTVEAAKVKIYNLYDKDFFVNPQVELTVVMFSAKFVTITGQVPLERKIELSPDQPLYLLDAIHCGPGFRRFSKRDSPVKLTRVGKDGKTQVFEIDVRKLSNKAWPLQEGDIITISEIGVFD